MATLDNSTTRSQLAAIRAQLLATGEIDKPTALAICDCDRLASRIWDLRNDPLDPMDIVTEYKLKRNRYGHVVRFSIYRLREEATA